jgi:hypothetical protein
MQRIRLFLVLLTLAAAFHAVPLYAGLPPPSKMTALCATAKASITIDRHSVEGKLVKTGGRWEVTGSATGALVEVRVEADRWQSDTFQGTSGTWDFEQPLKFAQCGHFGLRVYVYPSVDNGGHPLHCLDNDSSTPWYFDVRCGSTAEITHCDWECGDEAPDLCTGVCIGAAHEGTPPYRAFWGLNDRDYQAIQETSGGPWTQAVRCKLGERISFRVKDLNGIGRNSDAVSVPCGAQPGTP